MRGSAGPWLIDSWMDGMLATQPYVALHSAAPSPDDPTSTEIVGGWYARKRLYWDSLDDTALANATPIKWSGVPAITVAGMALYTTSTGSDLMVWAPYSTPLGVSAGGTITVAAHDLYIEMV